MLHPEKRIFLAGLAATTVLSGCLAEVDESWDEELASVEQLVGTVNLARNAPTTASSQFQPAANAVDGNLGTRWETTHGVDPGWIRIDLGSSQAIAQVNIRWETANAAAYQLQGSNDGNNWTTLASQTGRPSGERTDILTVSGSYRYLRVYGTQRSTIWGYSIWELEVYAPDGTPPPPPPPPPPVPIDPNLTYTPLFGTVHPPASSQEWTVAADGTLITRGSGRARSRHESEDIFYTFPARYFEQRTFGFEVHDRVAQGDNKITIYYEAEYPLWRAPECRSFYGNRHRAAFNNNAIFEAMVQAHDPVTKKGQKWRCTITRNAHNGSDGVLRVGDWVEVEFQQFIGIFQGDPAVIGQNIYYTDTYRYRIGTPGIHVDVDSTPAELAGGDATAPDVRAGSVVPQSSVIARNGNRLTYVNAQGQTVTHDIMDDNSVYPTYVVDDGVSDWTTYFREALNTQYATHNDFLNGRRIFHTFFDNGAHAEPGNPPLDRAVGHKGPLYNQNGCISCHINNGRGLAPQQGALPSTMVVQVGNGGNDALGRHSPHSYFGSQLQPFSTSGAVRAEAQVSVTYSTTSGQFSDGTSYQLQTPSYSFAVTPGLPGNPTVSHHSVRMPQIITGLGLLEAIPEETIALLHDPNDLNQDGISGRASLVVDPESGQQKIGRFGWKATHVSLRHFTAAALRADMGVTSPVFRTLDCGAQQQDCNSANPNSTELAEADIKLLVTYLQALGAPARRETTNPTALAGEQIFTNIGCASCHVATMNTGHRHPLPEMRGNTIHAYTDLLLHDMGPGLAEQLTGNAALNREWRTPPLWGLGASEAVSGHSRFLHDGRARSIMEAILWHGGEAEPAKQRVLQLTATQRDQLISFLKSL